MSGGPITPDNSTAEFHCTITALAESATDPKILWAGTDDGNVQITRDGGETWTNLVSNARGLPPESWVSSINTSYTDNGTAYVSFDRHQMDDFASYAYVTHDYGKTWSKIVNGLRGYVHVVAGDPKQPSLLYAGTELGFFASFDGGQNWTDLRLGLPPLPVYDLTVHPRDNDLIIATHARGFYILDDATPLQELANAIAAARKVTLFKPTRGTRYNIWSDTSTLGSRAWVAPNKPYGSMISYYLSEAAPKEKVEITILSGDGKVLRTFEGPGAHGMNRAVWNLREDPRLDIKSDPEKAWLAPGLDGVRVLAGEYTARLQALGETVEQKFDVRLDPHTAPSAADMAEHYKTMKQVVRMQYTIDETLERIKRIDSHIGELEKSIADEETKKECEQVRKEMDGPHDDLQSPRFFPEHFNLRSRVHEIAEEIGNFSGRPTKAQEEYVGVFEGQLGDALKRLDDVVSGNLAKLNERLAAEHVPNISPESELAASAAAEMH